MSFYDQIRKYKSLKISDPETKQYMRLLSNEAEESLEDMAQKAHHLSLGYFGKTIQLYTPLYLSNFCENSCSYCGFNSGNNIERRKLSLKEVESEAKNISATGLQHILILTGESRSQSPVSYLKDCVRALKRYFSSITIEVYPLSKSEYSQLIREGIDGLTIYQETYNEDIYAKFHPAGPKSDYRFRLEAPERAAEAGIRNINIGSLLGLNDWRQEAIFLGLHAKYLQDNFPGVEIGVSVPRLRKQKGGFIAPFIVTDKNIVQMIVALRIFLPRVGINISTRERPDFREKLIPLGVTRMSAGSSTYVGGRTVKPRKDSAQFETCDTRSVKEVRKMLEEKGYQPVLKDWLHL